MSKCFCGSDLPRRPAYDARGIFLTNVCDRCEREKLSHFRPDVLTDPNYEHDEPLGGDDDFGLGNGAL